VEVLTVQINLRYREKADHCDLKAENFRFAAYKNLFILTYGRTRAKEERRPLPSCLTMMVRSKFPDPNNQYTGFQPKKKRRL
jgi:hypothetical protein